MLGLDAQPWDSTKTLNADAWIGSVKIHGTRELAVSLSCSEGMARLATAAMFDVKADAATTDQLRDAWGELSNMVAGTFKSLLPGNCFLGLPSVVEGTAGLPVGNHQVLNSVGVLCGNDPLRVTIIDRRSIIRPQASERTAVMAQ